MERERNRKPLIALVILALIAIVGGTFAFFSSRIEIPNIFQTAPYHTEITETFESPSDWKPGDTTPKTVEIRNTGRVDVAVRVSYTEKWESSDKTVLSNEQDGKRVAIVNLANTSDWTSRIESGTTYYYFNRKLAPEASASSFIQSVTFNDEIKHEIECTTTPTESGNNTVCDSTGKGYDGATYTLTIIVESVQFDSYKQYWSTDFTISDN